MVLYKKSGLGVSVERIKIFYRGTVVWNTIFFIIMSLAFLLLQDTFYGLASVGQKETLTNFVVTHKFSLILNFFTLFLVFKLKKSAKSFFLFVILNTFVITCINLEEEFSKIIMMILFFYLVISIFMYQFLKIELSESYYNPRFNQNLWQSPMLVRVNVHFEDTKSGKKIEGYLTNWSEVGGYLKLNQPEKLKNIRKLCVKFEGREFNEDIAIVSSTKDKEGIGFKITRRKNRENTNHLGWDEFYEIMNQMGFLPELLT